jgi:hypothetical protein
MIKFKDYISLGMFCGVLAGVPPRMFNAMEYREGLTDERYNQTAASFLLPRIGLMPYSRGSRTAAALVNNAVAGVSGVLIAYLLSLSGRDRAVMKGAFFGAAAWMVFRGLAGGLGLKTMSIKPLTHMLSFVNHVIFGAGTAALVAKLGDGSMFRETDTPDLKEKSPLASYAPQRLWLRRRPRAKRLKGYA